MERSYILNLLKDYLKDKYEVLASQTTPEIEVKEETVLSQIGVTSVDFVMLLIFIEDELDVSFEDDALIIPKDITLGELVDRILKITG